MTRHRMRFTVNTFNNGGYTITPKSILGSLGTVCYVANSNVRSIFTSFKVREVEIWAPGIPSYTMNLITPSTVAIEWEASSQLSSTMTMSDTSNSVSVPAHVRARPPAGSAAAFWNTSTASTLFNLYAPQGSIVDVDLELIQDVDNTNSSVTTITTGTIGNTYYLALDGPATNRIVPIIPYATTS